MIAAVFDGGALEGLLDERVRRAFVEAFRDTSSRMLVPSVVVTEFLAGHPKQLERARRVLNVFEEPVAIGGETALRAAMLRRAVVERGGRDPGTIDSIVAALGEVYGVVVTEDRRDFEALAAAGQGFVVFDLTELRVALRHAAARGRRGGGRAL